MQRLCDDNYSMDVIRHNNEFVQYDIRSDQRSFQPLLRDDATDSAEVFINFPFLWIVLYVSTNAG